MSARMKCPRCGGENPSSAQYCASCGNQLTIIAAPQSNVPLRIPEYTGSFPFSNKPLDHALARLDAKNRTGVSRTRTGLYLIFVGIVFEIIPAVATYAGLSLIAGAVLLFLNRRAFGAKYQRYVFWSFVAVTGGVIAEIAGSFVLGVLYAVEVVTGGDPVSVLSSFFLELNLMLAVIGAVTGLGLVFFTYDMQNAAGRTILWTAYSLGIVVNVIVILVIVSQVQTASAQVLSQVSSPGDAFMALLASFAPWHLLQAIPAVPYAAAYYRAWSSVEKRATQDAGIVPR
jgi:hypothetical protein